MNVKRSKLMIHKLKYISLSFILLLMVGCIQVDQEIDNVNYETRMFDTVIGEVEIPVSPQRIVTDYYLGEFLILDIKPIIASDYALENPFLEGMVDGIIPLGVTNATNSLEQIINADPDLIVTLNADDVHTYSLIAPTVLIPFDEYNEEELFLYIADMLGKTEEATKIIEEFMEEALSYKDEINNIVGDSTISILELWPSELWVFGNKFARGGSILYDIWGLQAPQIIEETLIDNETTYKAVSLELIPQYTGDYVIVGVSSDADGELLKGTELWQGLSAVSESRVMDFDTMGFMHSDPISLQRQLEIYVDFFTNLE